MTDYNVMSTLTKHANLSEETHSKLMQYKAVKKLKSVDAAISKMFEELEWIA